MFNKKIQLIVTLGLCAVLASSCGLRVSLGKAKSLPTLPYQELESTYLQNYTENSEPMLGDDAAVYAAFREINPSADKKEVLASLNIIQRTIERPKNVTLNNIASLYLMLGQYNESFLGNNKKALKYYQKVWKNYEATPFLHPYFDPQKKELTQIWYLLNTNAEALMKAGDLLLKNGKKGAALRCYKKVLKNYSNELTGPYSMDLPDTYGRLAAAKIVEVSKYKAPNNEPVRSFTGDRRTEFTKMSETFVDDLYYGNTKKWMRYVSIGGVTYGLDRAERKLIGRDVLCYELQNKTGPQYDMLFQWVRSNDTKTEDVSANTLFLGDLYQVTMQKANDPKILYLTFKPIDSVWYLIEMSLY